MKIRLFPFTGVILSVLMLGCTCRHTENRDCTKGDETCVYSYPDILDIHYTPNKEHRCNGWFSDAGSWYGFTLPEQSNPRHGFCGPFDLDGNRREWISDALVQADYLSPSQECDTSFSSCYYPGELHLEYQCPSGRIFQKLRFMSHDLILLEIEADPNKKVRLFGSISENRNLASSENILNISEPGKEDILLYFPKNTDISLGNNGYTAYPPSSDKYELLICIGQQTKIAGNLHSLAQESSRRWADYLGRIIRRDISHTFNKIAVKSMVTLLANWKSPRGALLHEGVVPSQGVGYFMGFWGWDSWKHAAALAEFAPEIAENQMRAMFDYQTPEGMIIDCVFTDSSENNARNSKPPLAAWAVKRIFDRNRDTDFVREMLPKLVKYYEWWYRYRDHDQNGICEYGACDGTLEAAAWESGMDNAVRFDETKMVRNIVDHRYPQIDAWSMDQESVDLNAFLAMERKCIDELAEETGCKLMLDVPYYVSERNGNSICDWFYDKEDHFFHDRKLSGEFLLAQGTEACIPLWAGIANEKQAQSLHGIFTDSTKFATFIPFPTVAADNPHFTSGGYWRGPIWLDQVYFGISGLRKYGYAQDADRFTENVFERLEGLTDGGPIYENYDAFTGKTLEAPHFSWSAASLLLLYLEYGK